MYSVMCSRLAVPQGQTPEAVRRQFDAELSTGAWALPGQDVGTAEQPTGEPWWWDGDEEAAQSFLASMGVSLG